MNKVKLYQIIGLVGFLALIIFAGVIMQLVLNLVTIAVGLVLLTTLWFMTPPFLYALNIGSRQVDRAITQANPIDALNVQLDAFNKYILDKEGAVVTAMGSLTNLKRLFNDNKVHFGDDKLQEWTNSISKHEEGVRVAQAALSGLKKERESFRVEIKGAEADMAMATLSNGISGAINGSDSPALSDRRNIALEAIAAKVSASQARVDLALADIKPRSLA